MNSVHLLGRVITDPTLEETNNGRKICRFRLATSNGKNHAPSRHYIVILGKDATDAHPGNVHGILKRGGRVAVSGRISESRWQSKTTGEWRSRTEIVANNVEFITIGNGSYSITNQEEATSDANTE